MCVHMPAYGSFFPALTTWAQGIKYRLSGLLSHLASPKSYLRQAGQGGPLWKGGI